MKYMHARRINFNNRQFSIIKIKSCLRLLTPKKNVMNKDQQYLVKKIEKEKKNKKKAMKESHLILFSILIKL